MTHSASSQTVQLTAIPSAVNPLTGLKLCDVTARTATMCHAACLQVNPCLAVAYNRHTQLCAVFTVGTNSYNTTGSQVFIVETKTIVVRFSLFSIYLSFHLQSIMFPIILGTNINISF